MFIVALLLGRYLKYFEGYTTGFADEDKARELQELRRVMHIIIYINL